MQYNCEQQRQFMEEETIRITPGKLKKLIHDPQKSAKAINLKYVNDSQPGIIRVRRGKHFSYKFENETVKDKAVLNRIRKLVIPPAWENVWICKDEDGHIQVTGFDVRQRKQYRYHTLWNLLRNQTKFFHMLEFGEKLPEIRLQVEKDLARPGIPLEKVLATVISLMERTNIRIGSSMYEKENGSFGLSTLKDRHVAIEGTQMKFIFKGKKGVMHQISIRNRRLANIVKKCKDIPGKELFQYLDEDGNRKSIDSGMVNNYIREICGDGFTAKDFRTWNGTLQAMLSLKEIGCEEKITVIKKNVVSALDEVSKHLGNTRSVCRKYYVHPVIISLYENSCLDKYFKQLDEIEEPDGVSGLTSEERLMMQILKREAYNLPGKK